MGTGGTVFVAGVCCTDRAGWKILQYLSLRWAKDQGLGPAKFLVSWKSVIPSPWHILVCILLEASGEFDRMEEGKSLDSALQSRGRSCRVGQKL